MVMLTAAGEQVYNRLETDSMRESTEDLPGVHDAPPPLSPKKTLARKLRGVGRKVIRFSMPKALKHKSSSKEDDSATKDNKNEETASKEQDTTANSNHLECFTIEIDSDTNQVKLLQSSSLDPATLRDVPPLKLESKSLQSLEEYVLQEFVDTIGSYDEKQEDEEKQPEEGNDCSIGKPHQSAFSRENVEITVIEDFNQVSGDAIVLADAATGRHATTTNGEVKMDSIKDILSRQAPFLMQFTCGALECPPSSDPNNGNKLAMAKEQTPVISPTASEPNSLAWLGSPVDTLDEDESGIADDLDAVGGVDSQALSSLPVKALSSHPSTPKTASFHDDTTVESSVCTEQKREEIARRQWHKKYLHLSVQRLMEEEQRKKKSMEDLHLGTGGGEHKEEVQEIIQIKCLSSTAKQASEGEDVQERDLKGQGEMPRDTIQGTSQGKTEEKRADRVGWRDDRFHDDFDDFHFEVNFPNMEMESVQFEEEKKVEVKEDVQSSPTRKGPHTFQPASRADGVDEKKPGEAQQQDQQVGDLESESCLVGEEILEATIEGDVSVGFIVRDLDKLRVHTPPEIAAAKCNPPPPPPPPPPPSAVSKIRHGLPPLPPSPVSSPTRQGWESQQDRYSVEEESLAAESVEALPPPIENKLLSEFAALVSKHNDTTIVKYGDSKDKTIPENTLSHSKTSASSDMESRAEAKADSTNSSSFAATGENKEARHRTVDITPMLPSTSIFDAAEGSVDSEQEEDNERAENYNRNESDKLNEPTDDIDAKKSDLQEVDGEVTKFPEHDSIFDGTDDVPVATIAVEKKLPTQSSYAFDLVDGRFDKQGSDKLPCDEIIVDRSFSRIQKGKSKGSKRVAFDLSEDLKSVASMTTAGQSAVTFKEDIFYSCVGVDVTKAILKEMDKYIDSVDQYDDDTTIDDDSELSLLL